MDTITFDTSIDLADRIANLEKAIGTIVIVINSLPVAVPFDATTLTSQMDAFKTEFDAITGRLDADEKTLLAMGDNLKLLSPDGVGAIGDAIGEIKDKVQAFYIEVMGPAAVNAPFPKPPATSSN